MWRASLCVCVCVWRAQELNLPQEEWQDATGGAMLSLAVKFKDPLIVRWKSQFLWAGNAFPKRWQNRQGQVSRRLAGVGMYHPVTPRDGNIGKEIAARLGALQRKCVLAYFEFLRVTGSTDPMSQPDKLPPAFYAYYIKGRRETDPIEDMIRDGSYVRVSHGSKMLMEEFKELYNRFRVEREHGGKSIRFSEDLWRVPFSERGIRVVQEDFATAHEVLKDVPVIYNLTASVQHAPA